MTQPATGRTAARAIEVTALAASAQARRWRPARRRERQAAMASRELEAGAEAPAAAQQPPDGMPYSTADLCRPEYSTDVFRMYCFKVLRCSKRYAHDWRACPFAHPTENARRRDPREFRYSSLVCPDYRQGCCVRGDTCQYAHGVFESWLHPSRYRTQLCKDQDKCDRPVCFFAHSIAELRQPVDNFVPNPDERLRVPEAMQAVLGIASPAALAPLQQPDVAYGADQNQQQLELLSPQQQRAASGSSVGLPCSSSNASLASAAAVGTQPAGGGGSGSDLCSYSGSALDQGLPPGSASGASPTAPKQLVSPSAVPVPRMSNAFARKHGLDPKDNPLVNLQRLAMQQVQPGMQAATAVGSSGGRRPRRGGRQHQQAVPQQQLSAPLPSPHQQQQHHQQQQFQLQQQLQQQQQQQQQQAAAPPLGLQPLTLQPPQLLQPPPLSPAAAAAAAYYHAGSPSPMQSLPPAAGAAGGQALLDPQAMAVLLGGMHLGGGAPLSPAAAAAMAGSMAPPAHQLQPLAYNPALAMQGAGGMLTPTGGLAGAGPAVLGPPSPLGQPGMPGSGLPSPQPPPF